MAAMGFDDLLRRASLGSRAGGGATATEASVTSVTQLLDRILDEALDCGASDIHLEPLAASVRVRFRLDGRLREAHADIPRQVYATLLGRVRVMAQLDSSSGKGLPQDGHFAHRYREREIDVRVSTLPTMTGDKVVLRLLNGAQQLLALDALGFSPPNEALFRRWVHTSHGLLLNVGPVNSGKTTTLYAALAELNTIERNILTIEDPVECRLAGVNQMQVGSRPELTFAAGLRALLRQDPDVCMVGEIRDEETAAIAVRAALTGRLLLTTLHADNAIGAIFRLLDMRVEGYLLAASLLGVMAQRLVRRLCPHCREEHAVDADSPAATLLGDRHGAGMTLFRAVGCERCRDGYLGRLAIHELLPVSEPLRQAISQSRDRTTVEKLAREAGMVSMLDDGIAKAMRGQTTLEEVRAAVFGN